MQEYELANNNYPAWALAEILENYDEAYIDGDKMAIIINTN